MRVRSSLSIAVSDRGSAVIEFLIVGVLLLVPLAYGVSALTRVQAGAMASTMAVREAARAFVSAPTTALGQTRAAAAAELALADQGFDLPPGALQIHCRGGACLQPGSSVDIALRWQVPLPLLPEALPLPAAVPISAEHTANVDEYRGPG